jgi:hypothetical protein
MVLHGVGVGPSPHRTIGCVECRKSRMRRPCGWKARAIFVLGARHLAVADNARRAARHGLLKPVSRATIRARAARRRENMPPKKVTSVTLAGERYEATVLLVTARDSQGRPKFLEIMYEGDAAKVNGAPDFMIAYLPTTA